MTPVYRIHPALGVARLGDSLTDFCLAAQTPAGLPTECDGQGNPILQDGQPVPVSRFRDAEGRIKRQAARFQIYVYDEDSPEGRPLSLGDAVRGGGNEGTLADIQWRVHIANKKASWYAFEQLQGEHGYSPDHPRRNADVTGDNARQALIIDPGPQTVNHTTRRQAAFSRDGNPAYAPTFPPEGLKPNPIDTLGELMADGDGALLVLGGHGNSGTVKTGLGQPRIDTYANTDGWFDDIADGPVMARLVMNCENVTATRYIDVEYPSWVLSAYPRYAPQILDMVTGDDVVFDLAVTQFAYRTDLYGTAGTFDDPQHIDPLDTGALLHWKAGRVTWNGEFKPWFWRDVWPILFRPDEFTYLDNVLQASNAPHNQTQRGTFEPWPLSVPPFLPPEAAQRGMARAAALTASGVVLAEALAPSFAVLARAEPPPAAAALKLAGPSLTSAAEAFAVAVLPAGPGEDPAGYLEQWKALYEAHEGDPNGKSAYRQALDAFRDQLSAIAATLEPRPERQLLKATGKPTAAPDPGAALTTSASQLLAGYGDDYVSGALAERMLVAEAKAAVLDPYRTSRTYLYGLLRQPGEENSFQLKGRPTNRSSNLPLMPLLSGDNPISNTLPSKFLKLTDYQLFVLKQWSEGLFVNEVDEGWVPLADVHPYQPTEGWTAKTPRDLDIAVLTNVVGGAFCPGGEVGWIIRNPAAWREPYRLKASPEFYTFKQTAGEANALWNPPLTEEDYIAYIDTDLSQDTNFDVGLEPGDLSKYSALPWQADFNECSTQDIDVTYADWNVLNTAGDSLMAREQKIWTTLWWPAHRPMQALTYTGGPPDDPTLKWMNWAAGVPQTSAGDLKMTTEWARLGFVVRNPFVPPASLDQASPNNKYVCVESQWSPV